MRFGSYDVKRGSMDTGWKLKRQVLMSKSSMPDLIRTRLHNDQSSIPHHRTTVTPQLFQSQTWSLDSLSSCP